VVEWAAALLAHLYMYVKWFAMATTISCLTSHVVAWWHTDATITSKHHSKCTTRKYRTWVQSSGRYSTWQSRALYLPL